MKGGKYNKLITMYLLIFFLTGVSYGDEYIQKDLKVAIKSQSNKSVYIKGEGGDLYIELGVGNNKETFKLSKGKVGKIYASGSKVGYNGRLSSSVSVYNGDYETTIKIKGKGNVYKEYRGNVIFINEKGKVVPVNDIQSEEYLYSVVPSEIGTRFPEEAIKAQALAARTYLYYNMKNIKYKNYDLVDDVNSQMYLGKERENTTIKKAIDKTQGEVITYESKPINALYYSTSGGYKANNEDVWGGAPVPYLRGGKDSADESMSPRIKWSGKISKKNLSRKVGFTVRKITILEKKNNRNTKIQLSGSRKKTVTGNKLRALVGYTTIFSTQFTVEDKGSYFLFTGSGSGHGVGMSQYGAYGLSNEGKNYKDIIKHYYTGVEIQNEEEIY